MITIVQNPTPKSTSSLLVKAVQAVNTLFSKWIVGDTALNVDPADVSRAVTHCAATSDGYLNWLNPQLQLKPNCGPFRPFVSLAWWTDSIGVKHVRIVGDTCDPDSPVYQAEPLNRPVVWHVFPEFCYFAGLPNQPEAMLVCHCGAVGTAAEIDWRGSQCARCFEQPVASLPAAILIADQSYAFLPDGRGFVGQKSKNELHYVDLQTGERLCPPSSLSDKDWRPQLFSPAGDECLVSVGLDAHRWNRTTQKVTRIPNRYRKDYSPDGRWACIWCWKDRVFESLLLPVDWSAAGNPVIGEEKLPRPTPGLTRYLPTYFVPGDKIVDITDAGQIESKDCRTQKVTVLRKSGPFPGLLDFGHATPVILDLNWAQDRICLGFNDSNQSGSIYGTVLVSSILKASPWQPIRVAEEGQRLVNRVRFTPDAKWLIGCEVVNCVQFFPLDGGLPKKLTFGVPHLGEFASQLRIDAETESVYVASRSMRYSYPKMPDAEYLRRVPLNQAALDRLLQSHSGKLTSANPRKPTWAAVVSPVVQEPVENPYSPCVISDAGDEYQLTLSQFDDTAAAFEAEGYEGGGYGWHGVVDSLVRMNNPKLKRKLTYDCEGSMFFVSSKKEEALQEVAALIRSAISDPQLLKAAIANANPKLMG